MAKKKTQGGQPRCPNCKRFVARNAQECRSCGHDLSKETPTTAAPAKPAAKTSSTGKAKGASRQSFWDELVSELKRIWIGRS